MRPRILVAWSAPRSENARIHAGGHPAFFISKESLLRSDPPALSPARLAANRANAQLSTGPRSLEGKAAVSQNRWRHGLTGTFMIVPWECREDFDQLVADLRSEHQPSTPTETLLVDRMAQHHWLMQRALSLQGLCFNIQTPHCNSKDELTLYLRYQTTHERAFHKCLRELANVRAERRKARLDEAVFCQRAEDSSEVGFESQKRSAAAKDRKNLDESRKQAAEIRRQELHAARLNLVAAQIAAKTPRQPAPVTSECPNIPLKTAA